MQFKDLQRNAFFHRRKWMQKRAWKAAMSIQRAAFSVESMELRIFSSSVQILASFGDAYGTEPTAAVVSDHNGNLYGTTKAGGGSNEGAVFEIYTASGTIKTLAAFATGDDLHSDVVVDSLGNVYGTTASQDESDYPGTVFEIAAGSDTITTLATFGYNEESLSGVIVGNDGNLYGTTGDMVFEVVKGSGAITPLAMFDSSSVYYGTISTLVQDGAGNLYGTTATGGAAGDGSIFELANGSNSITTLASFSATEYSSQNPVGVVLDHAGNLYGTTTNGGDANTGSLFELAKGAGSITTLASFDYPNGDAPLTGVVIDSSGNLYGTSSDGGAHYQGTVFKFSPSDNSLTTLASFDSNTGTHSAVVLDDSGNLFGTTEYGGSLEAGNVVELTRGGNTLSTVATFGSTDGQKPSRVAIDGSGNLFGTTEFGGAYNDGTVFEVAAGSGTVTTLASFNGSNGEYPGGGVVLDSSGNLYGTTESGGVSSVYNGLGTVFEIAKGSGTITTLASFNGTDGSYPQSTLIIDSSGNLYGTTTEGGTSGDGTVFELAAGSDIITALASLVGIGTDPWGVVRDSAGNLFGATENGNGGTILELPGGVGPLTILASLPSGAGPADAALTIDSTGNVYGTGEYAAYELVNGSNTPLLLGSGYYLTGLLPDNHGDFFSASISGNAAAVVELAGGSDVFTTLATVGLSSVYDGTEPSAVISDSGGNIYGSTSAGVDGYLGTIYKLPAHAQAAPVVQTNPTNQDVAPGGAVTLQADASGVPVPTVQWQISTDGGKTFGNINGATAYSYSFTATAALNGAKYQAVFTNSQGNKTTTLATLASEIPTTLATFANVDGSGPIAPLVQDASGNLYGTTSAGGQYGYGTVFEIVKSTGLVVNLAVFDGVNEANPTGGLLLDSKGDLFGTTGNGSNFYDGSVYEIVEGSGVITKLASFGGAIGNNPGDLVMDAHGNLFGATSAAIFEIPSGGVITQIASFSGFSNYAPAGLVVDAAGDLFGIIAAYSFSSIFELASGSHTLTNVANFSTAVGIVPTGISIDSAGNLYGTTQYGGANGDGTIYELVSGSNTISALTSFSSADGTAYYGVTVDSQGNLFGSLNNSSVDYFGTIFELAHGSIAITTLASFNSYLSDDPAALTVDSHGNLYGTAANTVFEVANASHTITTLAQLDGSTPLTLSALTMDAGDNLYGVASTGGNYDNGNIFEISNGSAGAVSIASFTPSNGGGPYSTLAIDSAGDLFGAAAIGGASGDGSIFEIVHGSGTITTLAYFNGANGTNPNSVTLDSNGNLYGTTSSGGASGDGTIFEIVKGSGAVTTRATFSGAITAGYGASGLVIDPSNNLFGVTQYGGIDQSGVVFELAAGSGAVSIVHSFTGGSDGSYPKSLTLDASGNLLGTTNGDQIFEIGKGSATVSTLASLGSTEGYGLSPLELDNAGNIFGTATGGGPNGYGTVLELNKSTGQLSVLYSFTGRLDGSGPSSGVLVDSSGNIFGATSNGGPARQGSVFKLSPLAVASPVVAFGPANQTVTAGETVTLTAGGEGNPTPTIQWQISTNGGSSFSNISGATSAVYSFTAVTGQNGSEFRARFINSTGTITTAPATLTIATVSTAVSWTGAADGTNWSNPGNWSDNLVPTQLQDVSIGSGFGSIDVAAGSYSVRSLSAASPVEIAATATLSFYSTVSFAGGLTVDAGAVLQAAVSPAVLVVAGSSLTDNGTVDLAANPMVIHNGELGAITALLAEGYNAGGIAGLGIISSTATANPSQLTALGVIRNGTGGSQLYSTIDGVSLVASDILVKYTYYGDANLSGIVDSTDYTLIDAGYLSHGSLTGWYNGDFNYDGVINGSDYTLIDNAFNQQGASLADEIGQAAQIARPARAFHVALFSSLETARQNLSDQQAWAVGSTVADQIFSADVSQDVLRRRTVSKQLPKCL